MVLHRKRSEGKNDDGIDTAQTSSSAHKNRYKTGVRLSFFRALSGLLGNILTDMDGVSLSMTSRLDTGNGKYKFRPRFRSGGS